MAEIAATHKTDVNIPNRLYYTSKADNNRIKQQKLWDITTYATVGAGVTKNVVINTFNHDDFICYAKIKVTISDTAVVALYEGDTTVSAGTALVPVNHKRNVLNYEMPETSFLSDATIGVDGVLLQATQGETKDDIYIPLRKNTAYSVRVTPDNANTIVDINITFYEQNTNVIA